MKILTQEQLVRLQEIRDEIMNLTYEAKDLLKGTSEQGTAEAYYIGHIMTALGGQHDYMVASFESTLQKSIDILKEDLIEETEEEI